MAELARSLSWSHRDRVRFSVVFAPCASHFNYLPRPFRVLYVMFEPDLITKSLITALFYEWDVHETF
jgi:hypothetical protein